MSVESFRQNNFTADLASEFLTGQEDSSYWLGLQAYNELQTNTLSADDGHQVNSASSFSLIHNLLCDVTKILLICFIVSNCVFL